jgi:hypothetical protein
VVLLEELEELNRLTGSTVPQPQNSWIHQPTSEIKDSYQAERVELEELRLPPPRRISIPKQLDRFQPRSESNLLQVLEEEAVPEDRVRMETLGQEELVELEAVRFQSNAVERGTSPQLSVSLSLVPLVPLALQRLPPTMTVVVVEEVELLGCSSDSTTLSRQTLAP